MTKYPHELKHTSSQPKIKYSSYTRFILHKPIPYSEHHGYFERHSFVGHNDSPTGWSRYVFKPKYHPNVLDAPRNKLNQDIVSSSNPPKIINVSNKELGHTTYDASTLISNVSNKLVSGWKTTVYDDQYRQHIMGNDWFDALSSRPFGDINRSEDETTISNDVTEYLNTAGNVYLHNNIWHRYNENGVEDNFVYTPGMTFPKWIHINYGSFKVEHGYNPNRSHILIRGQIYSFEKENEKILQLAGIYKKESTDYYEDVNKFYSKKHNRWIVDHERRLAFDEDGNIVVGENITTENIAISSNIPKIFSKLSNEEFKITRQKWYNSEDYKTGELDVHGRAIRQYTYEQYLIDEGYFNESELDVPDYSDFDTFDYLGRPIKQLDRPERNKPIHMRTLRSQIKPDKYVYTDSKWSAPIVIMDTEATGLNSSRQLVNIAGIKLRYNFSTQQIGIEDVYERYYMPDWNKGEFRGLDINQAFLKYNDSDAAKLTKLFTWQIEHNRKTGHKGVNLTFDKKEQEAFASWVGGDSILVGNNIGFDLSFINKGFRDKYGYEPTALDLIQLAQSTSTFRAELDRLIQKEGRAGRLSVPGLMKWFVDNNYTGETHIGSSDTIDEKDIFHAIIRGIQNNPNQYAWINPKGIRKILEQGSHLTSKYVSHPYNIVNTIYEYDSYDNKGKPGTIGASIVLKNRNKVIDDLVKRFRRVTDIENFSDKDASELKKKLMTMNDKDIISFENIVIKLEDPSSLMAQGISGAVNVSDNYENKTESKLDAKTFSNVYMPTVYKSYLGKNKKGKNLYKNIRASMLGNVSDDEDLSDVKYGGTDYIDESDWTVDGYNPEENLYRMGVNGTSYSSWKDITEFNDAMYESPDETGIREVNAWREGLPRHLRNEIRWNLDTHKWEIKTYKSIVTRHEYNGRIISEEYEYSLVDGSSKIVREQVLKYGDEVIVNGKKYKVTSDAESLWEGSMADITSYRASAKKFYDTIGILRQHGVIDSGRRYTSARSRAWNMVNRVKDETKLYNFSLEANQLMSELKAEHKLNTKIAANRRSVESQLSSLVANKVMSQGDADFINKTYNAEIDNAISEGTMTAEKYAEILEKVNDKIAEATEADKKRTDTLEKSAKLLKKISPLYDFNNVYQAGYAQINGVISAAGGVLPRFAMQPIQRAGAALINGFELDRAKYNYYMRIANTAKGVLAMGGHIAGALTGGPVGATAGYVAGAGLGEVGVAATNMWLYGKERRITETGNIIQNSLNTVGFLKSISGLDIAFSALTKTVKWATLGFIGMVTKGLHSMQSLGNPITQLSNVDYEKYQIYGRMDRMFGFSNGTINSSIENFALQQRRMYTYGQMDIDRVVAASMLGVFGSVYASKGDPSKNYEETVNKIASGGITDTKLSWAAMIDKTLPQILQIMKDMNANTLSDVYKKSGVSFYELTDEGRKTMRKTSFGYRTALSNVSTMWQVMGASMWNNGLDKLFERVTKWLEVIAKNAGTWMGHINPLIDAFDNLFKAIGTGDSKNIKSAMENLKNEFEKIVSVIREPLIKIVSGLSVAMLAAVQAMMPTISTMVQGLISEISKFNFDKDALMSNFNKGTTFPVIRYGAQEGQFQYTGKSESERQEFNDLVKSLREKGYSTKQIIKELEASGNNFLGGYNPKWRGKYAHTDDYNPIPAVESANGVISGMTSQVMNEGMIDKLVKVFTDAMKTALKVDLSVKDENTGSTQNASQNENTRVNNWYALISVDE